ncbi:hypothetical protein JQ600_35665 [Bradyrhizobium sp. AUGA SZCCT0176]|uniref:hypothetical protein n=1 Tax=Bradyrhizobium sp. AUGA SZCCT0176 TaxID=2807664 RepID=UPI001BA576AD|nr:hypothetical protein [Bradyrhizobium sp. AUGA SZCCT0176]MBR1230236.1 hypothetical protein [Bradyrhizobium sp. AUGA SZCCT0176]
MPSAVRRTKYAAATDAMVCLMLDIRGRARENSLQAYSYGLKKVVNLPRKLIVIETPDARRWAAISVPRWLINREMLWSKPDLPPIMSAFCRDRSYDMRTPTMIRDEGERALAEYIASQQNKYRLLPGQHLSNHKFDRFSGNAFA